jgi:hypothetical protein
MLASQKSLYAILGSKSSPIRQNQHTCFYVRPLVWFVTGNAEERPLANFRTIATATIGYDYPVDVAISAVSAKSGQRESLRQVGIFSCSKPLLSLTMHRE